MKVNVQEKLEFSITGNLIQNLRSSIELSTSDYDKEKLQERLTKLSGGVVVLKEKHTHCKRTILIVFHLTPYHVVSSGSLCSNRVPIRMPNHEQCSHLANMGARHRSSQNYINEVLDPRADTAHTNGHSQTSGAQTRSTPTGVQPNMSAANSDSNTGSTPAVVAHATGLSHMSAATTQPTPSTTTMPLCTAPERQGAQRSGSSASRTGMSYAAHTLCRGFAPSEVANDRAEQYQCKVTTYVVIACIVAAVGGSIFCCDIGISDDQYGPDNSKTFLGHY
ncbi:hypothetical protein CTI12_AA093420 [Artemisia annua]|uniref:Uncharacterized protein n=1 Tax=Artemisia annua TaxID=35608 RepID=A0A2U1PI52_ARTAN|nr:hypothetical protein CTI12_AA093420 [Artemisia annua]